MVLRIGLTGGIGAGKSAVASCLVEQGAQLVDSDVLAREVVAPGTGGLAEVVEAFGNQVLDAAGALDRAALAARVFDDPQARARLEQIVHPRVRMASESAMAAASVDAVVVNDVPLLAEVGLAPTFDLVMVVEAPEPVRITRLEQRGMTAEAARSRIAAQTSEAQRRAVADVIMDNTGSLDQLGQRVRAVWSGRVVPFEANKRHHRVAQQPPEPFQLETVGAAARDRFTRSAQRLRHVLDDTEVNIDHIGPTAVPGLLADRTVDIQVTVAGEQLPAAAEFLTFAGFPAADRPFVHGSADPGNPRTIWLCAPQDSEASARLESRDYLRSHAGAREELSAAAGDCESAPAYRAMWSNWHRTRHVATETRSP